MSRNDSRHVGRTAMLQTGRSSGQGSVRATPSSVAERTVDHSLNDLRAERSWVRICRPGGQERDRFAGELEPHARGRAVGVVAADHSCVRPGRPPCDPPGDAVSIPKLEIRHVPPRFNSYTCIVGRERPFVTGFIRGPRVAGNNERPGSKDTPWLAGPGYQNARGPRRGPRAQCPARESNPEPTD